MCHHEEVRLSALGFGAHLTSRRHIDLLRVAAACC
jgi:hypothetical protein